MTKQRKALLNFLSLHADEELSAKQIESALQSEDISISAVYRNLSELEREGKIRRISKSGTREVFYLYTDCHGCKNSLHLSCEKCGKTYHMNISVAEMLVQNLEDADEFKIDKGSTVLYGVCKDCRNKEQP